MIKHNHFFVWTVVCLMALSACSSQNLAGEGSSTNTSIRSEPTQAVVKMISPPATLAVPATETPEPPADTPTPWIVTATSAPVVAVQATIAQPTPACTNKAELAQDLNLFGTVVLDAGQKFAKVWQIMNVGTCTWTTDYTLAFYSGEPMGSQASMPLLAVVKPGETIDLRLGLVAPFGPIQPTGN